MIQRMDSENGMRMQTAMPTKPANKEENNAPDGKAKSSKPAADPADAYKVEAAKIKTSFTNRIVQADASDLEQSVLECLIDS